MNLNEQYIVNNVSYLHTLCEPFSYNKCDVIKIALNNLDNITIPYTEILQSIDLFNVLDQEDLYVDEWNLDEYDDNFYNLYITIKSKSKSELLNLMFDFRDSKAILYMDFERRGIVISKDNDVIKKVKKAYPVYVQVEPDDKRHQEEYIVHHNFYNAMLKMYKYDDKYFLHMTNSYHHPIIINLIMDNFGENVLMGNSKEEVLERFYKGFIK